VENIQRTELTEADEADAYHQLSLIGVSAAKIAKQTGRTKTAVDSALKAKASTTGAKALENGYTVDMALVLAEFEATKTPNRNWSQSSVSSAQILIDLVQFKDFMESVPASPST
jgi:hypothetical protein